MAVLLHIQSIRFANFVIIYSVAMKKAIFSLTVLALIFASCVNGDKEEAVSRTICDFAEHLFNFRYNDAAMLSTPESKRVLSFMASNIDEKAAETIRNIKQPPVVTIKSLKIKNDTFAIARLNVSNEIVIDSIGKAPSVRTGNRIYTFTLVYREKGWLVRMEDLPRSEK